MQSCPQRLCLRWLALTCSPVSPRTPDRLKGIMIFRSINLDSIQSFMVFLHCWDQKCCINQSTFAATYTSLLINCLFPVNSSSRPFLLSATWRELPIRRMCTFSLFVCPQPSIMVAIFRDPRGALANRNFARRDLAGDLFAHLWLKSKQLIECAWQKCTLHWPGVEPTPFLPNAYKKKPLHYLSTCASVQRSPLNALFYRDAK